MIDKRNLARIIKAALKEDVGRGDITSKLLIPKDMQAEIVFAAREEMVACGTFIPGAVYAQLSRHIKAEACVAEGSRAGGGMILAKASGPALEILTGEREALNLMQRMCGVATLTRNYVDAVAGTKAVILDTRKTMPGLRAIDKYAVATGGGKNHRMRLDDMVLIKDNHIAVGREQGLAIGDLVRKARQPLPSLIPKSRSSVPVVVECDTLEQLAQALAAAPDRILLDNMDIPTLKKAVAMAAGKIPLEASGGVSLQTVRAIAETGVDFISVGKITHSAPAVDIGADIVIKR